MSTYFGIVGENEGAVVSCLTGIPANGATTMIAIILAIIETILIFIPITEIVTKFIQNVLSKCVKPKLIPKMDFKDRYTSK